ncbi:hypothetical protein [Flavobacterium sp. CF136]|uniref:hypothetical protein n=1 Tax=Flavobacterium sp. (strain CF136) TaxID=1144313 RepID=UPI000271A849|nr:hypothetical protein [Flavobacterium sp. CF136]EJL60157.1 hypothetical protein PMI10_03925 [Flavobacterium sp. CF136]
MKNLSFIVFAICLIFASCSNDENSQEEDSKMYDDIIEASLANSQTCTNPEEWNITGIGAKGCGGYAGYIVYSKKINSDEFLAKVKKYTDAQKSHYDKESGIGYECSTAKEPTGIECIDGKPTLTYFTGAY